MLTHQAGHLTHHSLKRMCPMNLLKVFNLNEVPVLTQFPNSLPSCWAREKLQKRLTVAFIAQKIDADRFFRSFEKIIFFDDFHFFMDFGQISTFWAVLVPFVEGIGTVWAFCVVPFVFREALKCVRRKFTASFHHWTSIKVADFVEFGDNLRISCISCFILRWHVLHGGCGKVA